MAKKQNMETETSVVETRSLGEIEEEIGRLVAGGIRISQRIAVLVATAKAKHFESIPEWLEWCSAKFGFARRTAYQLAAGGGLLLDLGIVPDETTNDFVHHDAQTAQAVHHDALLGCDLVKLESLAVLRDRKKEQFEGLLRHWDPSGASRAEVAAKVKAFLGEETYTLTCGDCKEEFESEHKKTKRCPNCQQAHEAKCEKEKERRNACAFERHLTALAELFNRNDELAKHVPETAPGIAFAAATVAADLAVTHVAEYHDMTRPDLERWLGYVDTLQDTLRNLVADANA